jgi:hypothetical protein
VHSKTLLEINQHLIIDPLAINTFCWRLETLCWIGQPDCWLLSIFLANFNTYKISYQSGPSIYHSKWSWPLIYQLPPTLPMIYHRPIGRHRRLLTEPKSLSFGRSDHWPTTTSLGEFTHLEFSTKIPDESKSSIFKPRRSWPSIKFLLPTSKTNLDRRSNLFSKWLRMNLSRWFNQPFKWMNPYEF